MTAARYQDQVLDRVFFDFYQQMSEERGQVAFQQDGASSHTAKSTSAWLQRHSVQLMPHHPASSPDVSPIEPLWKTLKSHIQSRMHIPSNVEELKVAAQEAWEQITVEEIDVHVRSMGDRVQVVLNAKGGHTRY